MGRHSDLLGIEYLAVGYYEGKKRMFAGQVRGAGFTRRMHWLI